jgi:hypothetical protein
MAGPVATVSAARASGPRRGRRHVRAIAYDPGMATYAPIHGAGDGGWFWHLVAAELRGRGQEVAAPDLPTEDDAAGLPEYAEAVVEAGGDRGDLIVVALAFGGFTAPLVCDLVPADLLVLLAGMVPSPGERPGDWWANTGYRQARRAYDERHGRPPHDIAMFFHDVPPDLAAESMARARGSPTPRWSGHGRYRPGRRCRPGSCSAATTASSRPSSCAGWSGAPRHRPGRDRRQPLRRPQPPRELADRLEGYRAAL